MGFYTDFTISNNTTHLPYVIGNSNDVNFSSVFFVILIVHVIIIILTVFGNILVIISFLTDGKLRCKPSNWFLFNLSIADFFVGLVSLSINCVWWVAGRWPLGEMTCKFYIVIDCVAVYESVLTVIGISIDRMVMITYPVMYRNLEANSKLHKIVICFLVGTWIIVTVFYGLVTFTWSEITDRNVIDYADDCEGEYITSLLFRIVLICIELVIPFVLLVSSNIIIYRNIRERGRKLHKITTLRASKDVAGNLTIDPQSMCDIGDTSQVMDTTVNGQSNCKCKSQRQQHPCSVRKRKRQLQRHRRLAVLLTIFVGIFLVTWLPYYVTVIFYALCKEECVSALTWEIVNLILWANSACNPWLYAAMNTQFRKCFMRYLSCLSCRHHHRPFL